MKKFLQKGIIAFAGVAFLAAALVPAVHAQNTNTSANGFRISPVRGEYTVEKGKSTTFQITLENPSDARVTAQVLVNDFVPSDSEDGEPRLILDENAKPPKNSLKTIAQVANEVQLGPKEKKEVQVTLRVPADANSGGYYGAVRFVPVVAAADAGNVGLTASVGTIILLRVPGDLTEKMDLLQLSAAQKVKGDEYGAKSFITKGDVSFIVRLKNTGDIHVKPFGRVDIKNMFGKTVASYELNNTDPRANVLPDSTRKFVDHVDKKKWFGRYTIHANISYQQGSGNILSSKSSFWYIPTWALIVLFVLLAAVAVGVYLLVRKLRGDVSHRAK